MSINVDSFLKKIKTAGVVLWIDGEDLRVNGPTNILTPDIVEILKNHKREIIQILQHQDRCIDCENKEYINLVGTGCVKKIEGNWLEQWRALDKLDGCPRGFWN